MAWADMCRRVWQSLKPEADRLGKLAEWEKEFSQVRLRSSKYLNVG